MTNYHVSALVSDDKLTLLYQLQPGVCSKSFGVDVASIAHFPQHVIDDAKKRIVRLEGIRQASKYFVWQCNSVMLFLKSRL